jgi:hypothetical protein
MCNDLLDKVLEHYHEWKSLVARRLHSLLSAWRVFARIGCAFLEAYSGHAGLRSIGNPKEFRKYIGCGVAGCFSRGLPEQVINSAQEWGRQFLIREVCHSLDRWRAGVYDAFGDLAGLSPKVGAKDGTADTNERSD